MADEPYILGKHDMVKEIARLRAQTQRMERLVVGFQAIADKIARRMSEQFDQIRARPEERLSCATWSSASPARCSPNISLR
jgi:hypothetical protein